MMKQTTFGKILEKFRLQWLFQRVASILRCLHSKKEKEKNNLDAFWLICSLKTNNFSVSCKRMLVSGFS